VDPIVFREIFPAPRSVTAAELIASLDLSHHDRAPTRPYTIVNFVTSVDGRTAIDGRSRGLSDAGDRELHRTLREHADAVLAGTGTIAADDYGRMLPGEERRERRLAAARAAEPLAVTVTRSGDLPLGARLFNEPDARIIVFSPEPPAPPVGTPGRESRDAHIQHEPLDLAAPAPLTATLRTLRTRYAVETLLFEGGPTLFGALLREGLVDTLFLTLAPTLVGGGGPAVVGAGGPALVARAGSALASGPPPGMPAGLKLVGVMEREGSLFLRYTPERR
jgi:5-amino-6-(5-phosphoribosylamino)uracil reductase